MGSTSLLSLAQSLGVDHVNVYLFVCQGCLSHNYTFTGGIGRESKHHFSMEHNNEIEKGT